MNIHESLLGVVNMPSYVFQAFRLRRPTHSVPLLHAFIIYFLNTGSKKLAGDGEANSCCKISPIGIRTFFGHAIFAIAGDAVFQMHPNSISLHLVHYQVSF